MALVNAGPATTLPPIRRETAGADLDLQSGVGDRRDLLGSCREMPGRMEPPARSVVYERFHDESGAIVSMSSQPAAILFDAESARPESEHGTDDPAGSLLGSPHFEAHHEPTLIVERGAEPPFRELGKYQLREVLGCGGQSIAFKAWDRDLLRHVVIKLYHNAASDEERQRILAEGRALARVRHSRVCTCFSVDRLGDMPYLVLQYIPGETLQLRIEREPLVVEEALDVVLALCDAVSAIHQTGLLHCDLKPSNIMIDDDNRPTVIDLGLATTQLNLTPDDVAGTPAYLAPERANGDVEEVDQRCDVFGLGAILYELLTGRAPFANDSRRRSRELAKMGQVPPISDACAIEFRGLESVVMRAVARRPGQRFATVREFGEAVNELVSHDGHSQQVPSANSCRRR